MDKIVVERALKALAEIGATRHSADSELRRKESEFASLCLATPVKTEKSTSAGTPCDSPHCAGCYGVGDGRTIHPPKCSGEYRKWLERWQPKGKPQ